VSDRPDEPGFMRAAEPDPRHWWGRRLPSLLVLLAVLAVAAVAVLVMTNRATTVLPEVGRDRLGEDNWSEPIGLELANGFQVARVPDCAAGAFTRFVLWNPDSEPYWEVEGPPTPLNTFLVGVAPEGFTTVTPFSDPPSGAVLRLVAFRRDGGAVGIRFQADDLRETRVVSGNPLVRYTVEGFQEAEVCSTGGSGAGDDPDGDESDPEADDGTGDLFPGTTDGGLGSRGSTTTIDDGTGPIDD